MQHLDRRAVFGTAEDGFLQQWMRLRVLQLLHNTAGKVRGDELRLADHYGVYQLVFVEGGLAAAPFTEIPYPLQRKNAVFMVAFRCRTFFGQHFNGIREGVQHTHRLGKVFAVWVAFTLQHEVVECGDRNQHRFSGREIECFVLFFPFVFHYYSSVFHSSYPLDSCLFSDYHVKLDRRLSCWPMVDNYTLRR
ncbi:hypothetical protein D3C73_1190050 [compost metagenome]